MRSNFGEEVFSDPRKHKLETDPATGAKCKYLKIAEIYREAILG
jgi:hypothetical protein